MTHKEGRAFHEEIFQKCNTLMYSIVQSPVPIIAQVDGIAAAAGCQLVSICDIAVATEKSKFLGWGLFQYFYGIHNFWENAPNQILIFREPPPQEVVPEMHGFSKFKRVYWASRAVT